MAVSVMGEDLPPELFTADLGWQTAVVRRAANKDTRARSLVTKMESVRPKAEVSAGARQSGDRVKRELTKAGRMPPLPKEDAKIIIRPKGGLAVARVGATTVGRAIMEAAGIEDAMAGADVICPNLQQNIVVASTLDREHATRYTRIKAIRVENKPYEVSAYPGLGGAPAPGAEEEEDVSGSRGPGLGIAILWASQPGPIEFAMALQNR
ncbi:hypothetical protein HPB49_011537 [Dermacentor silvarum]|uniref:Uncharacterized protein n=1 Tax=Dermacentor silvarum TaxID=543639 RepID=A0ACB8DZS8_DERSI|nr:hypothetical protein HPB49_011537 [Dermacentor silvarum]